jgi:hypothetical protein
MPLINVKLIENVFTPDQKREIVEEVARADQAASCGRPSRRVLFVPQTPAGGTRFTSAWRVKASVAASSIRDDRSGRLPRVNDGEPRLLQSRGKQA